MEHQISILEVRHLPERVRPTRVIAGVHVDRLEEEILAFDEAVVIGYYEDSASGLEAERGK